MSDGKDFLISVANRHCSDGTSFHPPHSGNVLPDKRSSVAMILRLVTTGSAAACSMTAAGGTRGTSNDSSVPPLVARATVADVQAVCRENTRPTQLQLLLIRRSVNPGDRWSGDLALPGGRVDVGESLLDACVREVREEVGIRLDDGGKRFLLLGQGDTIPVFERRASHRNQSQRQQRPRRRRSPDIDNADAAGSSQDSSLVYKNLVLAHFVWLVRGIDVPLPPLTLCDVEVAACAWVDVGQVACPGRALVPLRWQLPRPDEMSVWDACRFSAFNATGLLELFFPSIVLMPSASTSPLPTASQWLSRIQSCAKYPRVDVREDLDGRCTGVANTFKDEQWVLWGLTLIMVVEMLDRSGVPGALPPRYLVYSRSQLKDTIATTLFPSRFSSKWIKSRL